VAYQADILINVRGFRDLDRIQKALDGTIRKINEVNKAAARMGEPVRNLERFTKQVQLAEKALQLAAIGSKQEQRAVNNYVTALQNSNIARTHQNKLIDAEITKRTAVASAIRKSVEANVADSRAMRQARAEASALNKELADQERLQRKLAERGLMQLKGGAIAKGTEAGFGVQGPKLPSGAMSLPAGVSGLAKPATGLQAPGVMDAILGGAFPALFGAGPGAMAGGAIGGLVGGQMGGIGGMALSIAFSAVGQQLDEAIKKVKDLGDAIQLVDVDKLRESFVFVNDELEVAITRSIRLGDIEGARALAAAAAAQQTGALGTAIQDSANATALLGNSWTKVSGTVSTLLSMLAAPFAAAIAGILELVNLVVVGWNKIFSMAGAATKAVGEFVVRLFGGQKAVDFIKKAFEGLNVLQHQANAAAQLKLGKLKEETMIANALFSLESKRTQGVTAEQQLQNIDISLRQKKLELVQQLWNTEERVREENKGASEEKISALVQEEQKKTQINIKQAELIALREREKVINSEIVANDRLRLEVVQAQARVADVQAKSAGALLSINMQKLEQQREFVLSLNQETAVIQQMTALRQVEADLRYEAALREQNLRVQTAALELASVEAEYERGFATEQTLQKAQLVYNTSVQIRDAELGAAAAVRDHEKATATLIGKKETVNAYADEYTRQTEAATRALNAQQQAVQNQLSITQAIASTAQTINNIEIDNLRTRLQQTSSEQARYAILSEIRDLEIANAELVRTTTLAQIDAEVQRQRIANEIAVIKYKELEAVVKLAEAQGVLTRAHVEALNAQRDAYRIATAALETTTRVADQQRRAADAVYNAAVEAANLRVQTEGAAAAAGSYAGNMERAAGAISRSTQTVSGNIAYGAQFGAAGQNAAFMAEYAAARNKLMRQTISGPEQTYSVEAGERAWARLTESFMQRAEEYNRRVAAERNAQAVENWRKYTGQTAGTPEMLSGIQRYGVGSGASTVTPQVNITTGPVTQMDGTNYVTMNDLQQATSSAAQQGANLALSQLQNNPSVRRSVGVAR